MHMQVSRRETARSKSLNFFKILILYNIYTFEDVKHTFVKFADDTTLKGDDMIDDKNQCSNFSKLEYGAIKITKIEFKKDKIFHLVEKIKCPSQRDNIWGC